MSRHLFYYTVSHTLAAKFCFKCFRTKKTVLFHLPQSLSLFFFDGRGILEASMAFITVKSITGSFRSFCIDCIYFTSQKVSFNLSLSLRKSNFYGLFDAVVGILLLFLVSWYPFPSFHKANCVRHCAWDKPSSFWSPASTPNIGFTCNCTAQCHFHQKDDLNLK